MLAVDIRPIIKYIIFDQYVLRNRIISVYDDINVL